MEQEKNKLIQFRHIVKEFDGQVVLKVKSKETFYITRKGAPH